MPTATFPYGYAKDVDGVQGMGTMLTFLQLMTKATFRNLHPEFRRRVFRMMQCAAADGVPLGVGTGWRVQPSNPDGSPKPGFAKPGNSNHESFPAGSGDPNAVAADMVPNISWDWMERNVARFGLRTFKDVNKEPWHIQPAEIPASRNWRTTPWHLDEIDLPPSPDDDTPPTKGRITVQEALTGFPTVRPGDSGVWVGVWQAVVNESGAGLKVDRDYGNVSSDVCKFIQASNGLPVTGVVDNATWSVSFPKT